MRICFVLPRYILLYFKINFVVRLDIFMKFCLHTFLKNDMHLGACSREKSHMILLSSSPPSCSNPSSAPDGPSRAGVDTAAGVGSPSAPLPRPEWLLSALRTNACVLRFYPSRRRCPSHARALPPQARPPLHRFTHDGVSDRWCPKRRCGCSK